MSTRRRDIISNYNCFFITSTINHFIPLFSDEKYITIITDSLTFYSEKYDCKILAFVIMPEHIHIVIFFNNKPKISDFMRDFKKFTSFQIRTLLIEDNKENLLQKFSFRERNQKYRIWMDRFDLKVIISKEMLKSKVDYIHNNPVKRGLVDSITDWTYSSAGFYFGKNTASLDIRNYGDYI